MINFRKRICPLVSNVFPGIVVVSPGKLMAENLGVISKQICVCFFSVITDTVKYVYWLIFQRGIKSEMLAEDLIIRNLPYKRI